MPYGQTMVNRVMDNMARYRVTPPREKVIRDRSLSGKARIKARRAANKSA